MTSVYAGPVQRLIDELGRLPGIGPKSAQRVAFFLRANSTLYTTVDGWRLHWPWTSRLSAAG